MGMLFLTVQSYNALKSSEYRLSLEKLALSANKRENNCAYLFGKTLTKTKRSMGHEILFCVTPLVVLIGDEYTPFLNKFVHDLSGMIRLE